MCRCPGERQGCYGLRGAAMHPSTPRLHPSLPALGPSRDAGFTPGSCSLVWSGKPEREGVCFLS